MTSRLSQIPIFVGVTTALAIALVENAAPTWSARVAITGLVLAVAAGAAILVARRQPVGRIIASTGIGVFVILLALLFAPIAIERLKREPFNSEVWKSQRLGTTVTPRILMVDDLLSEYDLTELNRNQLESLLGAPDESRGFVEWDLVYWLGPERYWQVDSEWLAIRLDDNGRVREARIVTD